MATIIEYTARPSAIRGFKRLYGDQLNAERFVEKLLNGKFGFDKDAADAAAGIGEMSEGDQDLHLNYGHVNCPHCGVHLSNGVDDYDVLADLHGETKAYALQQHEWACLGCNGEWGAEIPAPKGKARKTPAATGGSPRERSTVQKPTKVVWDIANANPDKPRKEIIAAAVATGVHPGTAATQYQLWRKAAGIVKSKG